MECKYSIGCYPSAVRIISMQQREEAAGQSIRIFVNCPGEDNSYLIKITFPVGDRPEDFFGNKDDAEKMEVFDEWWECMDKNLSEDGTQYQITLQRKLSRAEPEETKLEGVLAVLLSELCLNTKAGTAEIKIEIFEDSEKGSDIPVKNLRIEKVQIGPVIQEFIAEPYCVAMQKTGRTERKRGERQEISTLHWKVVNADKIKLLKGDACLADELSMTGKYEITVDETAKYTLVVSKESNEVTSTISVQRLPVRIDRFEYLDGKIVWNVFGAEENKIVWDTGTELSAIDGSIEAEKGKVYHFRARGGDQVVDTWLAWMEDIPDVSKRRKNELMMVEKFQKTVTDFGGFQILNVSWKTKGLQKLRIVYQDYERGRLYSIKGQKELSPEGEWEQIIYGSSVKMTLEATVGNRDFHMTI